MKLGLISGYSGRKMSIPIDAIKHAENLGYESIWTSEAYGSDAITPAAWILAQTTKMKVGTAIMQMPARTPGYDSDEPCRTFWWAIHRRFGSFWSPGCRRLAWRALW